VNAQEAGRIQGSGHVTAPFTNIRDTGTLGGNATQNWQNPPVNSPDSSSYYDPMWQKGGQPPLNSDPNLPFRPVPGGVLNESLCTGGICPPGIYYATEPACNGCINTRPSGAPIRLGSPSSPTFRFGGSPSPGYTNFADFYFIGGLDIRNNTALTLDPGRYAFLGVADNRDPVLNIPNGVTMTGGTSENGDPGRILIATDFKSTSEYPGVAQIWANFRNGAISGVQGLNDMTWTSSGLMFNKTAIQAGQNDRSVITMYGLKKNDPDVVQAGLNQFTPAVFWQDQHNSYVNYNTNGTVDQSCGTLNSFCANSPAPNPADAPQLEIWATPWARWGGMIYQPRGAWTRLQASGEDTGPLMIVTGGLNVQGTGNLTLSGPSVPLTVFTVALVE
ncbi:MAG: hypothetical protein SFV51_27710, partial [Bryobacteraceae bacterium]|nr:hypothetical protein [Bryobacteraceae bacterium]